MLHRINDLLEPDNGCEGFMPGEEPAVTLILDDQRRIRVYDKLAYEKGWDVGGFISDEEIDKYSI
ncbi:MAG: hypothetical protein IJ129_03385 [Ruminococcus sp.]|nr:hypothetical protein [Ruminococcus sp.]